MNGDKKKKKRTKRKRNILYVSKYFIKYINNNIYINNNNIYIHIRIMKEIFLIFFI